MPIYRLGDRAPRIDPNAFVAAEATLIGDVTIGAGCSVWPGAVLRGDCDAIVIGAGSSVQEGAVLHTDAGRQLIVGERVTIGHQAMLHGCEVRDGALIGIRAVVLDGAAIERECLVGAGAVVPEGRTFAPRSLILGMPARAVRKLTAEEVERLYWGAGYYIDAQAEYRRNLVRLA